MALGSDGGLGSCHWLGLEARDSSGKRGTSLLKLRVGTWNIGSLTGKLNRSSEES